MKTLKALAAVIAVFVFAVASYEGVARPFIQNWHSRTPRKGPLVASIASVIVYGLGASPQDCRTTGYGYKDQWISELMAVGSPVRPVMATAILVHGVLLLAFGMGIWQAADGRTLRWIGVLLMLAGTIGFPTHTVFAIGHIVQERRLRA